MAKRSDFARRPMDNYATPFRPAQCLVPFLVADCVSAFAEPCCGNGDLVNHLECFGFECVQQSDIRGGVDAFNLTADDLAGADVIVTNPPWTRQILLPLAAHLISIMPTWLLLSADFPHMVAARRLIDHCSLIVPVGRVRWMPGTKYSGKDNVCWYRLDAAHSGGPRFVPRQPMAPAPRAKRIREAAE